MDDPLTTSDNFLKKIQKEWPVVMGAPRIVASFCFTCFVAGFALSYFVSQHEIRLADREREYYRGQITKQPLKEQVVRLCDDLDDFAGRWEHGSGAVGDEWALRFRERIRRARSELDDARLHSPELDQLILLGVESPAKTRELSLAFRRVAKELSDGKL